MKGRFQSLVACIKIIVPRDEIQDFQEHVGNPPHWLFFPSGLRLQWGSFAVSLIPDFLFSLR